MDTDETKISVEIPAELHGVLSVASKKVGMDESCYATKIVLEYLKTVQEDAGSDDGVRVASE